MSKHIGADGKLCVYAKWLVLYNYVQK